jgi:hypothetical protein
MNRWKDRFWVGASRKVVGSSRLTVGTWRRLTLPKLTAFADDRLAGIEDAEAAPAMLAKRPSVAEKSMNREVHEFRIAIIKLLPLMDIPSQKVLSVNGRARANSR